MGEFSDFSKAFLLQFRHAANFSTKALQKYKEELGRPDFFPDTHKIKLFYKSRFKAAFNPVLYIF